MRVVALFLLLMLSLPGWAASSYAIWGEAQRANGFTAFPYVDVAAPKGGELRLVSNLRYSTFDKYNPFTLRGSAPAYLADLLFESLLTSAMDEAGVGYGLLAEDVTVAPDRLSATFRLRPEARFHNGDPVLAEDVRYSYETLIGPAVSPAYATLLQDVAGLDVLDARTVRFRFRQPNRELPLTVGSLPIFSHRWGAGKPFDQVVTETPIGSGPYRIGPVVYGRDITYVRDPDYWARELNVRRGMANFDRITVRIYADQTARLEALKAGQFDLMQFYSAGDWARRLTGRRFDSGELVKGDFANRQPSGFQSSVLNSRRPLLQDARVRQALGLAFDFEWLNQRLFYDSYRRVRSLFGNTGCEAQGLPSGGERALLERWHGQIPAAAFGPMPEPPRNDEEGALREHLRQAQALLREAGWQVRDGVLRNAQGQALVLEYLDSSDSGARVVAAWARNLKKLGIQLNYRTVDFALYLQRLDSFDFDITTIAYGGTLNPGQEFADLFGSQAARTEGSGNYPGVASPAVDDLVTRMVGARDEQQLRDACHALDRVIASGYYLMPQYYAPSFRLVYNNWRLQRPTPAMPAYAKAEEWVMLSWWARQPALSANPEPAARP